MKKSAEVPKIVENINRVHEQPGPVNYDIEQMQIPSSLSKVPGYVSKLLTKAGHVMVDDKKPK